MGGNEQNLNSHGFVSLCSIAGIYQDLSGRQNSAFLCVSWDI